MEPIDRTRSPSTRGRSFRPRLAAACQLRLETQLPSLEGNSFSGILAGLCQMHARQGNACLARRTSGPLGAALQPSARDP
jgi:hypothetical protein